VIGELGLVIVGVVGVIAILGGVWFWGMRTKAAPVLDLQRRINRKVFNPRQMRTAGQPGAYAGVVRHVGRRTGAAYETPVVPFPTGDGFVIVLPYGTRPDWVRNVLAAGSAVVVHEGRTCEVTAPEVTAVEAAPCAFPEAERRGMRRFGNTECLVVRAVEHPGVASVEAADRIAETTDGAS
jgi:deazaflavin-dependent oxidoreductase (nitroreductase family)